ncbi:hypothetical protein EUTSA_v10010922mg, partial [Eutrema salsugineum]
MAKLYWLSPKKITVDVPSPISLPSLEVLTLRHVVYKDEDSHVRLLAGCPTLKSLMVVGLVGVNDNVINFSLKVPSLRRLVYIHTFQEDEDDTDRSLVIDTPELASLEIQDFMAHSCSIEYMPRLAKAIIKVDFDLNGNFRRSLSSIKHLTLVFHSTMVPWSNTVNYSGLIQCSIVLCDTDLCESLVVLLSHLVDQDIEWNQPSSVPKCLSSSLEIFGWKGYEGRENEKQLVRYILENSKCLKKAGISPNSNLSAEETLKMTEEFKSMHK